MGAQKLCMHVHMSGKQCRRVALKDKSYCHFHYENYRRNCITDPGYELPILEDCRSVMLGISDVVRTRIKKKMDDKEMTSMMYAMQVATGLMNKVEAMSPDITEEMLENQSRVRRGGARAKEPEPEDKEGDGPSLLHRLMDGFGDLLEGNPDDPNSVRPKRTTADYKRIVEEFQRQVPHSKEKLFDPYPDRFWEEELNTPTSAMEDEALTGGDSLSSKTEEF